MTVVEFLIQVLKAHAQTLQRLAAFFGENELLEILEQAGDLIESNPNPLPRSHFHLQKQWFSPSLPHQSKASPYIELEGAVKEFNLPAILEFHLWAYGFYRTLIESPLDLKMNINPNEPGGEALVAEALFQAKLWISQLPIQPFLGQQVETLALVPWIRFRTETLKGIGKRPFEAI